MAMEYIKKSISYDEWLKKYPENIIKIPKDKIIDNCPYNRKEREKYFGGKEKLNEYDKHFEKFIKYRLNLNFNYFKFGPIKMFHHDFHIVGDFFNDDNIFELKVVQKTNSLIHPYNYKISYETLKVDNFFNNNHNYCKKCNCLSLNYKNMNMYYLIFDNGKLFIYDKINNYDKKYKVWIDDNEIYKKGNKIIETDERKYKSHYKNVFRIFKDEIKEIDSSIEIPDYLKIILGTEKSKKFFKKK